MTWKKDMSAEEKLAWKESKKAEMDGIEQMLSNGIKNMFASEDYANYLKFYSGFHHYSLRNCVLILMQNEDATLCASSADWKKKGRHVKKDEKKKGLAVIIPAPKKIKRTDKDGNEEEVSIMFYKKGTVFDISQTEGEPLPEVCKKLTTSLEWKDEVIEKLQKFSKFPITFEEITNGANGFFSRVEGKIVVQDGMSDAQTVKTLIHELTHSILHCKGGKCEKADRDTKELQAESVAFCVCNALGIDTSEYSFGYVAGWSKNQSAKDLEKQLNIIGSTAASIIDALGV